MSHLIPVRNTLSLVCHCLASLPVFSRASTSRFRRRLCRGFLLLALVPCVHAYQGMTILPLHVEGRYLVDSEGKKVNLHGYMQPAASWFNGEGRNFVDPSDFTSVSNVAPSLNHINSVARIMTDTAPRFGRPHGWYATFVRFIGDNGGVSNFAPGWNKDGLLSRPAQFTGWINNLLVPYIDYCRSVGLYVVICGNPSVAYPGNDPLKNMTKQYQDNLKTFWTALASHPSIKNADNVIFEVCNEPILIETSFGAANWGAGRDVYWAALTKFMQPIVDTIRGTGAQNVLLIPGLGWQGEYQGFPSHPLEGTNLGYAAHLYPAYGNVHNNASLLPGLWASNYKPAADQLPMVITELMWTPNSGVGYEDLWNATTEGFGLSAKACFERQGNVSYLVGMTGDVIGNITAGMDKITFPTVQGAQAAFSWLPMYTAEVPTAPTPPAGSESVLVNISTRSNVGADMHTQIAGFVIQGTGQKRVLIRAAGPALSAFELTGLLENPVLTLINQDHQVVASNDNWVADLVLEAAASVGAFSWTPGSADSALVATLAPGAYTAQVTDSNFGTGVGLVEIYDADQGAPTAKIINLSTRSDALTGAGVQIAGFVVRGASPKKILLRASGPALTGLGVVGAMSDPVLTLLDASGQILGVNDNWEDNGVAQAAVSAGAFAWTVGSADAAMVVTLIPGNYTAQVAGKGGSSGIALAEVYEVP